MNSLFQSGRELYGLFERPLPAEEFDAGFCRALAEALKASDVLIHEHDGSGAPPALRCAYSPESGGDSPRSLAPDARLISVVAATGEIASHHEADLASPATGLLRLAVPVSDSSRSLVIEILKTQAAPQPEEKDVVLIQIFGGMLAARAAAPWVAVETPAPSAAARPGATQMEAIGRSSAFTRAQVLAVKAARSDFPVLILGETGTGKELIARRVHDSSRRKDKPYVAINCGALSDALLESEFFGHARGAFTGAFRGRRGRLEEANGGTVFLDEVGEMSPACQVKLLRTLETGEITPLGGNKTFKINVRFIAATHRNLELMIQQGKFREDLFYRLSWMRIEIPPLRRRRGDTELLARFFLEQQAEIQQSEARDFSSEALEVLKAYDWPGNIRELQQVVASSVAVAEGNTIEIEDLPPFLRSRQASVDPALDAQEPKEDEKTIILKALAATAYPGTGRWNLRAAARSLGMNRQTFGYKVRKVYRLNNE